MKRLLLLLVLMAGAALLSGCGQQGPSASDAAQTASAAPAQEASRAPEAAATVVPDEPVLAVSLADPPHMDLTALSDTVAYSQMINIAMDAADYEGQTLRLRGTYVSYVAQETGKLVHYIAMLDQTACCQVAMEFRVAGPAMRPEDYPRQGSTIELTALIGTFVYNDYTYPLLTANGITVLEQGPELPQE